MTRRIKEEIVFKAKNAHEVLDRTNKEVLRIYKELSIISFSMQVQSPGEVKLTVEAQRL